MLAVIRNGGLGRRFERQPRLLWSLGDMLCHWGCFNISKNVLNIPDGDRPFLAFGVAGGLRDLGAVRAFEVTVRAVLVAAGLEGSCSVGSAGGMVSRVFRVLYA